MICRTKGEKRSIKDILSNLDDDDLEGYVALDDGIIHIILNMVNTFLSLAMSKANILQQ